MQSELQFAPEGEEKLNTTRSMTLIKIIGFALVWAFIMAAAIGSFAAAVWTVIPTEMLEWGASTPNLVGYVSHCSFAPVSTGILSIVSLVGILLSWKLKTGREIGIGVFIGTGGGLVMGLAGGIDITMFIGMGSGVGVGVVLGILIGLLRRSKM